ncbi:MAG TPA: NAD-dependent epimerase/dehydratase family protein [Bacillota bacterium]|jgi:dihydroflavonol-4-reductase|nr:NAD-dependent epimerase/dehydratase family protein [Fastidiosipila sp.]HPX93196.1 NAD-dependent epimerase/dehydratase family protein [Bacillota bacterium]HQB81104.1 NAD-dependent epimerase/dehydratase family protein [Bacillota bacterium]
MTARKTEKERIWLVTGASGHLGNTVVRKLLSQGEEVRAFILEKERPVALQGLKCEVVSGDVTDAASIEPLFAGLEDREIYLLHLASLITIYAKAGPWVYRVNPGGTRHMLEAAKRHGVKRFLYCGTVHTLPLPEDFNQEIREVDHYDPDLVHGDYAKSKAMASQLVLDAARDGLDAVIVQPSGIIGPNDYLDGNFTRLFEKLVDRKLPAMIQGSYNFVDVNDVAEGLIAAAKHGRTGESYNLTGHNVSVLEIMNRAAEMTGRKPFKSTAPLWLAKLAALPAEWWSKRTGKTPVLTGYSLFTMSSPHRFSHEKASRELGYTIRPLDETIGNTLRFMIEQKRFKKAVDLRYAPDSL